MLDPTKLAEITECINALTPFANNSITKNGDAKIEHVITTFKHLLELDKIEHGISELEHEVGHYSYYNTSTRKLDIAELKKGIENNLFGFKRNLLEVLGYNWMCGYPSQLSLSRPTTTAQAEQLFVEAVYNALIVIAKLYPVNSNADIPEADKVFIATGHQLNIREVINNHAQRQHNPKLAETVELKWLLSPKDLSYSPDLDGVDTNNILAITDVMHIKKMAEQRGIPHNINSDSYKLFIPSLIQKRDAQLLRDMNAISSIASEIMRKDHEPANVQCCNFI